MSIELQIFKTLWGNTKSLDAVIADCRENEFDGIEGQAPRTPAERDEFRMKPAAHGWSYIQKISPAGSYVPNRHATQTEHLDSFRLQAEAALECRPLFLTLIAGCDAWSVEQSVDFFGLAMA